MSATNGVALAPTSQPAATAAPAVEPQAQPLLQPSASELSSTYIAPGRRRIVVVSASLILRMPAEEPGALVTVKIVDERDPLHGATDALSMNLKGDGMAFAVRVLRDVGYKGDFSELTSNEIPVDPSLPLTGQWELDEFVSSSGQRRVVSRLQYINRMAALPLPEAKRPAVVAAMRVIFAKADGRTEEPVLPDAAKVVGEEIKAAAPDMDAVVKVILKHKKLYNETALRDPIYAYALHLIGGDSARLSAAITAAAAAEKAARAAAKTAAPVAAAPATTTAAPAATAPAFDEF